ncbi:MAG: leucine-rich repeat domain-containing protein [Promethearchaeota archaeon]
MNNLKPNEQKIIVEIEGLLNIALPIYEKEIPTDELGLVIENGFITMLSLCGGDLESIPESLFELTHLKSLNLQYNPIAKLSKSIAKLKFLEKIALTDVAELPNTMANLKELRELEILTYRMEKLPSSFKKLNNLQILTIESNIFIEGISSLKNLKELDLTLGVEKLPESIGNLSSLETLYTNSNLPESISKLNNLKTLVLRGEAPLIIPNSITKLNNLESIVISVQGLIEIPEIITKIASLKELHVDEDLCAVESIPENIGNLQMLITLEVKKNIETLPKSLFLLKKLKKLKIGDGLSAVSDEIRNLSALEKLDLKRNKLKNIPEFLGDLVNLKKLDLSFNNLDCIPGTLSKLRNLTQLDLSYNNLKTLPESFSLLVNLKHLELSNNGLGTFPDAYTKLHGLQSLNLSHNNLKTLPESIAGLENIESLNISHNQLETLPDELWKLNKLKNLKINDNMLQEDYSNKDTTTILEAIRKKAPINIFMTKSTKFSDEIKQIVEYLLQQDEINAIYTDYSEKNLGKCQLIIYFIDKAISETDESNKVLAKARELQLEIIPIKTIGVDWGELDKIGLSRKLGFEFGNEEMAQFCPKLYEHVYGIKRDINLYDPKEALIDKQVLNVFNTLANFFESSRVINEIVQNFDDFKDISDKYEEQEINLHEYAYKIVKKISDSE